MNSLAKATKALQQARYDVPEELTPEYINAIHDLAVETAYHLRLMGVVWEDIERNAHTLFGTSVEQALTGPIFDIRNQKTA